MLAARTKLKGRWEIKRIKKVKLGSQPSLGLLGVGLGAQLLVFFQQMFNFLQARLRLIRWFRTRLLGRETQNVRMQIDRWKQILRAKDLDQLLPDSVSDNEEPPLPGGWLYKPLLVQYYVTMKQVKTWWTDANRIMFVLLRTGPSAASGASALKLPEENLNMKHQICCFTLVVCLPTKICFAISGDLSVSTFSCNFLVLTALDLVHVCWALCFKRFSWIGVGGRGCWWSIW